MELEEFLRYMDSGQEIIAGSPVHQCMHKLAQEAMQLTAELNSGYHTNEEIVELMRKITGRLTTVLLCSRRFIRIAGRT